MAEICGKSSQISLWCLCREHVYLSASPPNPNKKILSPLPSDFYPPLRWYSPRWSPCREMQQSILSPLHTWMMSSFWHSLCDNVSVGFQDTKLFSFILWFLLLGLPREFPHFSVNSELSEPPGLSSWSSEYSIPDPSQGFKCHLWWWLPNLYPSDTCATNSRVIHPAACLVPTGMCK